MKTSARLDWTLAGLWFALTLATLPLTPAAVRWTLGQAGLAPWTWLLPGLTALGLGALLTRDPAPGRRSWTWIALAAGLYTLFGLTIKPATETTHFLQYGLLAWFLGRALAHHLPDLGQVLALGLLVFGAGTLDEMVQFWLPNRAAELRDVGLNTAGGLIALLGLWLGLRVLRPRPGLSPRSGRVVLSLSLTVGAFFGLLALWCSGRA